MATIDIPDDLAEGEPIFVLRGSDAFAQRALFKYASELEKHVFLGWQPAGRITEVRLARDAARTMRAWFATRNPGAPR